MITLIVIDKLGKVIFKGSKHDCREIHYEHEGSVILDPAASGIPTSSIIIGGQLWRTWLLLSYLLLMQLYGVLYDSFW